MKDNEIIMAVRSAVLARLAVRGIAAELKQAYQPTQQGVLTGTLITMHKVWDRRHGSPQRLERWNETTDDFDYVESQQMESSFQFGAEVLQNPDDDTELTAADVLKATAFALQSDAVLTELRAAGLGVLRVRDIRTGYTTDDGEQFQANPSFDVVFTHRDETVDSLPAVVSEEIVIHRV